MAKPILQAADEPIAIIGIGCRFPGKVSDPKSFWELLKNGTDAITEVPKDRWNLDIFYDTDKEKCGKIYTRKGGFLDNIDKFDPGFFGISPREAAYMDPQQRLLLQVAYEALEDGGCIPEKLAGRDVGVFVGVFMHDYENTHAKPGEYKNIGSHSATGMSTTLAANRISYIYDFRGPSMVIDTACSSSLIAVHLACDSLLRGESELALAGGVNVIFKPEVMMILCKASMLSPDGYSKAFDASANGYARSEGAGIVVLKKLSQALKDNDPIYAVIKGSAINQDGRTEGSITVPSKEAQQRAIQRALKVAGIKAKDIDYIEAHGTGTPVGDPIEANALGGFVGKNRNNACIIGSLKTNIGHTESAAGVASLIKVALMLQHRQIPPHLHFKNPNPKIAFEKLKLRVPTALENWESKGTPRTAGVNSFGFGGSNAHMVVQEFGNNTNFPKIKSKDLGSGVAHVISLSAHTQQALTDTATAYLNFFYAADFDESITVRDIGYTTALHKGQQNYRAAIVATSMTEVKASFKAFINGEKLKNIAAAVVAQDTTRKLAFIFSGMGQQWWKMGRELFNHEPIFTRVVKECDVLFKKQDEKFSLIAELLRDEKSSNINETQIAQPAIFAIQVALAKLWMSWGIVPSAVLGHSVGELAAAYISGALSLEDAVKVCFIRSTLQERMAGKGGMLAVGLSAADAEKYFRPFKSVAIAAVNSPTSIALAGSNEELAKILKELEKRMIFARLLKVVVPYHSMFMEPILAELNQACANIKPQKNHIPWVSTVTGNLLAGEEADANYWVKNVRYPVHFSQGLHTLMQFGSELFIEIGAHPVLSLYIKECAAGSTKQLVILPSLKRQEADAATMFHSLGQLYCLGYPIAWKKIYDKNRDRFIRLPKYSWQNESYWNESKESQEYRKGKDSQDKAHLLLGEPVDAPIPTWQTIIDVNKLEFLADHKVDGAIIYPAAGYVEIGLALAKKTFGDIVCGIENLEIKAPLVLRHDTSTQLQTVLGKNGLFSVYSKPIAADAKWAEHASGIIALYEGERPHNVSMMDMVAQAMAVEEKASAYKRFAARGLEYGSRFQAVSKIWLHQDGILGRVEAPREIAQDLSAYWLHPVVLDACLQITAAMPMDGTFLPCSIDKIILFNRPTDALFGWAKVVLQQPNKIKCDIQIVDDTGNTIALVSGLECRYVAGTNKKTPDTLQDNIYEYEWIQDNENHQTINAGSYLPSPLEIKDGVSQLVEQFIRQFKREYFYRVIEPEFSELTHAYIIQALKNMGCDFIPGEIFSAESLANKLRIIKDQRKLFNRFLEILAEEKILTRNNDWWQVIKQPAENNVTEMWRRMFYQYPDHVAELTVMQRCGSRLAGILRGNEDPIALIFPPGSMVIEHLYRHSPAFNIYNRIVQEVMGYVVNQLPTGQTLRILEIGAGTGSLSAYVLPLLPQARVKYFFTDISAVFTKQAEQKFSAYNFIEYKILDIEKDPENFAAHSFDIILVSDALHATTSLDRTFAHVKKLLVSNGLFIFLEPTKLFRWFDLVFGTLKGWWLFDDYELREKHILMVKSKWLNFLTQKGFTDVIGISDEIAGYESLHHVFVARGPQVAMNAQIAKIEKIANSSANGLANVWLIFADELGGVDILVDAFKTQGIVPKVIKKGKLFKQIDADTFIARPGSGEDIDKIFALVGSATGLVPYVINMWNVTALSVNNMALKTLEKVTNEYCMTVVYIIQAMIKREQGAKAKLYLVTNGIHTLGGIKDVALHQSPIHGLGRVALAECISSIRLRMIDISIDNIAQEAKLLFAELFKEDLEDEVCIRKNQRYVHRLLKKHTTKICEQIPAYSLYKTAANGGSGFVFEETQRSNLAEGEVEIAVKATGLNFADGMQVDGLIESETDAFGRITSLGMEVAGVVTKVGAKVSSLKIGDEVLGLVPNGFGKYSRGHEKLLVQKPAAMSFEDAATIPVAFLTAYYTLHNLAKIKPQEKILIHNATEALGLASIQVARAAGAKIFATAATQEQRELLQAMGIAYVGDSKAEDFYAEIMLVTAKQGVDVVVNSLTGKWLQLSIRLLKTATGRIVDLKRVHEASDLPLKFLAQGMTFFTFDLKRLVDSDKDFSANLFAAVMQEFNNGSFQPIPYRVFPIGDIGDAFSCMNNPNHLGKTIVSSQETFLNITPTSGMLNLREDATYLIAGGLGGFGLATAEWLSRCNAKHLVLLGRSGAAADAAQQALGRLKAKGVEVLVVSADVTDESQMTTVFEKIKTTMPPLRGVIHAAMVLEDGAIADMDANAMRKVLNPKVLGAWNLHKNTLEQKLDFFLLFSSMASLLGNVGQGNYAAGNGFLDLLSYYRKAHGLVGLTICWGHLTEVGYVAKRSNIMDFLALQGMHGVTLNQAWQVITHGVAHERTTMGAMSADWKLVCKYVAINSMSPKFLNLVSQARTGDALEQPGETIELMPEDVAKRKEYLLKVLTKTIAEVLGINAAKLNVNQALDTYGLDSLMAIEMVARIKQIINVDLPKMTFLQAGLTLLSLVAVVEKELTMQSG